MTEQVTRLLDAVQRWAAEVAPPVGEDTGSTGCGGWCPVCRAVERVQGTSPEVRAHLATATTSLLSAAASLLDGIAEHQRATARPPSGDDEDRAG